MGQRRKRQKKTSRRVSDHFSRRDFECKCDECKGKLRISLGLIGGLELLRSKAQNRINILKGYECPDSAEKSSGFKRNYHRLGIAADITVDNLELRTVFELAQEVPEFQGVGLFSDHIHVDTRKEGTPKIWEESA